MHYSIPMIDISPLFGVSSLERDLIDQAIMAAKGMESLRKPTRQP
jgi:hypothetical protein